MAWNDAQRLPLGLLRRRRQRLGEGAAPIWEDNPEAWKSEPDARMERPRRSRDPDFEVDLDNPSPRALRYVMPSRRI